mmetsp:Transcript_18940/g.36829  ORF Transcript_18940/g.36829 Transcript_18940/m.36829 type:complete len:151 (-) Transcript_18940:197-649(-)
MKEMFINQYTLSNTGVPLRLPHGMLVHNNAAGYNDRDGFLAICEHFVKHVCAVDPDRKRFLFIDGHDSHFNPRALRLLLANNVFPFFLRANNSSVDQPNDNGPNAVVKSNYGVCYDKKFASLNRGGLARSTTMNPSIFNEIFLEAWNLTR